jgi:hypothetical protein
MEILSVTYRPPWLGARWKGLGKKKNQIQLGNEWSWRAAALAQSPEGHQQLQGLLCRQIQKSLQVWMNVTPMSLFQSDQACMLGTC